MRSAAERRGERPSAYARQVLTLALGARERIPSADPALLEQLVVHERELRRLGNLLNQVARRLHSSGRPPAKLEQVVRSVRDEVAEVRTLIERKGSA